MTEPNATPAPPKPRRRVVKNTVFSLLSKVIGALLTYLSTLILLRALSVEEYGFYSVLFTGGIYNLGMLTRMGIPAVLTRFIPEYYAKSNYRLIDRLFAGANIVQAAAAAFLLILVFIFAPTIAGWVNFGGSYDVLRVFAVAGFLFLITENFRILLGGLFQQRAILEVNFVYNIVRIAVLFGVTRFADPLLAVVAAEGAVFGLMLVLYYRSYRKIVKPHVAQQPETSEPIHWRRFTRYAVLYQLNEFGATLLNQATDLFLVSGFLGGLAVGLYGLASRILNLIQGVFPHKILGDVIEPLFFSEYGASDAKQARFGFNLLIKVALLTSLPLCIWLALMSKTVIVDMFDARYADATWVLAISALFMPQIAIRQPLYLMLQNAERPDLLIYAKIWAVLKILLAIWLVPQGGAIMMAWLTAVTTTVHNGHMYYYIVRKLDVHMDYRGFFMLHLNGAISAALFYPLTHFFHGIVGVVASGLVYGILFIGICLINRSFTQEERDLINSKLPKKIWRF